MEPPLADRLTPCGPVLDARAAGRMRGALEEAAREEGWSAALETAWSALAPAFTASPYLWSLARSRPSRLGVVLREPPEQRRLTILQAARLIPEQTGGLEAGKAELRRLKAELHLLVALCDLSGVFDLGEVTLALSRFADAAVASALRLAAQHEADRLRLLPPPDGAKGPVPGLFCLALGKLGAGELNYSSDVDLSFFYDPAALPVAPGNEPSVLALRLTQTLVDILQARTPEGYVFRVDLRLRPDPSSTPAAVPVEAALDYYETVGQNWERAAMIKARVCGGDQARGEAFVKALQPFIWRRHLDYGAIADIHAIKRQIHVHKADERLTAPGANLKLGAGGIREIEFYVQTQQLIFGGRDDSVRAPATLEALAALNRAGPVSEEAARDLSAAYERLRFLEHRVQMVNDEQTHVLPESRADRRRVAALSGFGDLAAFDASVSGVLRRVNARYGALFAKDEPLSSRFGSLVFTGVEDDPETMKTLSRMGFSNPAQVSGLIRSWHHGRISATRTERGRELFTRLAPRLLQAAQATGAPDAAFNRFADFFTGLRSGVQVQSLFLAEPKLFRLVVEVMAFAPRLAATLARQPGALDSLLDPDFFGALQEGEADRALGAALAAEPPFEEAMDEARRIHREQAFRIGVRIVSGTVGSEAAAAAFTDLADACIRRLSLVSLEETRRVAGAFAGQAAIVALGKAGSREMTATSDLDLMTLYQADGADSASSLKGWGAETFFARFTQRLVAALSAQTAQGGLYRVDLQLRPSGTAGPVAVSLGAFRRYYAEEAETWEHLSLTRGRVVWATSEDFAEAAAAAIRSALRRRRRRRSTARDVLDMRALMRAERPSAGLWDLKLNDGGLVDIEFAAQYLQIVGAAAGGPLEGHTGRALERLREGGAADAGDLQILIDAWRLQQALSQVLKAALEDGADPQDEPPRFRAILSRSGAARDFRGLRADLKRRQAAAHQAYLRVLAA